MAFLFFNDINFKQRKKGGNNEKTFLSVLNNGNRSNCSAIQDEIWQNGPSFPTNKPLKTKQKERKRKEKKACHYKKQSYL